ncbi:cytochrome P450 family protein [Streptomyces sp. NPDC004126]|uniref:cytochrome P450 family protein n=1 Tax=Streptomyces sp. NPDC004126 TaxID=3390695 RepID=UPI003CFCADFF
MTTEPTVAVGDGPALEEAVEAVTKGTPEYRQCPYPVYRSLREQAPIARLTPGHGVDTYLVTRYEDAHAVLADHRIGKDMHEAIDTYHALFGDACEALDDNLLFADPPRHTRLRHIAKTAFTPRHVKDLRPHIQELVDGLLDRCPTDQPVDLMSAFALPLPVMVICELLGIVGDERVEVLNWFAQVTRSRFSRDLKHELVEAEHWLRDYFTDLIHRTRENPTDDFLSVLAETPHDEEPLTDDELVSMIWVLLFAGHKTTTLQIGNCVYSLLTNPEQLEAVQANRELLPQAIEEMVRFEGSVETSTFRYALEDVEIGGTLIPRGAVVQIALASANRDPEKFPEPDRLDVTREGLQGNHLGFGFGAHYCLGAPLARLELEICLTSLLDRFPDMVLAMPSAHGGDWLKGPFPAFRGLERLPVALDPSRTVDDWTKPAG